jgi:glycosyltransferase involved in cell wall biosynthesis
MAIRVLHVTTVPVSLGFLRGQVGYMKRHGFEVHALSSAGEALKAFGDAEQVPVYAVEMPRRVTPLRDLAAVGGLLRVLEQVDPHIVHAHTPKGGLLGMIAARMKGVPVRIYHMRGLPFMTATGPKRALLRWTERAACTLANQVFCVSPSLRQIAIRERICSAERLRVLAGGSGNGVDANGRFDPEAQAGSRERVRERHGIPRDAALILFVGRIVRDKGLVELAGAWEQLRARYPGAHLVLVGPMEPQDPLPPEVSRQLRQDPRVHLTGMQREIASYYAAADVVALPTYREGLPNVILEAGAMRIPVVTTRIPGCVDAVEEGATGLLVAPRDSAGLAAALERYLADPALRRAHGDAGRTRVLAQFRPEAIWRELHDAYLDLLRGRQGWAAEGPPENLARRRS